MGLAADTASTGAVMYYYSFLFAGYYFFYLVELVEGFHWGEVVDVEPDDLVAHLTEDGVVQLEEAELHALAVVAYVLDGGGIGVAHACPVGFELLEDNLGAAHDALGHAGYLCHMDTEGVLAATWHELAQEDNLTIHFLHTDVVVLDTVEVLLHLIEFVIMSGK